MSRLHLIARVPRASALLAVTAAALAVAGCADQDMSYVGARSIDPDHQSGLGNPQAERPIVVAPSPDPNAPITPRYQWNGNPQRVIEGKAATPGAKRPELKPQPPKSAANAGTIGSPEDARQIEVQAGDTLHGIAERYGVTVASLNQANGLSGAPLKVGQKLVLPPTAR